jgi:hypothetical protein
LTSLFGILINETGMNKINEKCNIIKEELDRYIQMSKQPDFKLTKEDIERLFKLNESINECKTILSETNNIIIKEYIPRMGILISMIEGFNFKDTKGLVSETLYNQVLEHIKLQLTVVNQYLASLMIIPLDSLSSIIGGLLLNQNIGALPQVQPTTQGAQK